MSVKKEPDASAEGNGPNPDPYSKDEAAFKKLPKADQWRRMAAEGDVRGLLDEMGSAIPGLLNFGQFGGCLRQAVDVLAKKDPTAFAEFLHTEILGAAGKLVIQGQILFDQQLRRQYEQRQDRPEWSSPGSSEDAFVAKMMALHLYVAKLQQLDANTQRLLEQARKQRLANDAVEAKKKRPRQPTRRQRLSASRQQPTTPTSRIGEGLP